jgi:hypothetical protein
MKAQIRVVGAVRGNRAAQPDSGELEPHDRPIDDRPHSVYEIVTRQMLEELKEDVSEIKGRINTLLWLVAGAVLVELVMRLLG